MHNRKAVTKVLYHAFVILFGFMMVYPVLWMISGSFKGNAEILRGTLSLIPKELKLTNYATGWKGFVNPTSYNSYKKALVSLPTRKTGANDCTCSRCMIYF